MKIQKKNWVGGGQDGGVFGAGHRVDVNKELKLKKWGGGVGGRGWVGGGIGRGVLGGQGRCNREVHFL